MHSKFDKIYSNLLDDIANLSTCVYYKVGAIIVDTKTGNMVWGYNGTPKGFLECKDVDSMIDEIIINPDAVWGYLEKYNKYDYIMSNIVNKFIYYMNKNQVINDVNDIKKYLNIVHSKYEIHAEQNAILKFRLLSIDEYNREKYPIIMYVSHLPCFDCAKLIIASGIIDKIVYKYDYIDKRYNESSFEFLESNRIKVYKM